LSLTPSSDWTHLKGTTHILLVSHAFRELALPFFFHTVVISRPEHYVTFFDPEHGLFVADETARKRWSFVRQLGVVRWVRPEISPTDLPDGPEGNFLVPLQIPEGGNVKISCILDSNMWGPTPDWSRLSSFWNRHPLDSDDEELDSGLTSFEESVRDAIHKQKDRFIHRLNIRDTLSELRMSTVAAATLDPDHPLPVADDYKLPLSVRLYHVPLSTVPRDDFLHFQFMESGQFWASAPAMLVAPLEYGRWWLERLAPLRASFGRFTVLRLEDFPRDHLEHMSKLAHDGVVWMWQDETKQEVVVVPPVSPPTFAMCLASLALI
jgi:hypothetical protein